MSYILFLGRLLFSAIFILASIGHFSSEGINFAASQGVPFPVITVPVSGLIALFGGLSILLGYKARMGAWLIFLFLLPVTFFMHNFWNAADPAMANIQQAMFLKNLSIMGGALLIAYFGSGPLSLKE